MLIIKFSLFYTLNKGLLVGNFGSGTLFNDSRDMREGYEPYVVQFSKGLHPNRIWHSSSIGSYIIV